MTLKRALSHAALWLFHVVVVRPVLRLLVGVRYRRRSLVPRGPCLVVANHNSHLDAPVLLSLFPLGRLAHVHPVAAADYFGETWLRRTMAMVLMNAIPIERSPGVRQEPLAHVVDALEAGESIILFPEGTRGEAGVVAPFRSGVGRIVRAIPDLPVVPVFLHGTERIWPRGVVVPVPLGIDVHVGRPRAYPPTREAKEIAEEVRRDVLALAPSPPPAPGPRNAPFFAAVCGGAPDVRRAVVLGMIAELGSAEGVLALGLVDRTVEADSDGVRDSDLPTVRPRAWHGLLARLVKTRPPYDGAAFAALTRRARQERAASEDVEARFFVAEGSALVDLLVSGASGADDRDLHQRVLYAEGLRRLPVGHWWRTLRRDPEVWLLNALSFTRMRAPGLVVLLSADDAHRRVGEILRRARRTEVLEIDGAREGAASAVAASVEACRRLAGSIIEGVGVSESRE